MKKIILPLIISFIILISNYSYAITATVNVTAVRIRESASTEANIVINVYEEDEVEILEETGEWYKVKYGEKVGYAKAEFFTKKATSSSPTTEALVPNEPEQPSSQALPEEPAAQNLATTPLQEFQIGNSVSLPNAVKVRIVPSFLAEEKNEITANQTATVETKLGNWYKITAGTTSGWITQAKLTAATEVQQVPQTPEPPTTPEPEVPAPPQNTTPAENTAPEEPTPEKPQETKPPQTSEEKPKTKTAVVIVETARVRSAASTSASIIDVLDEDDVVKITGEEGNFYKISTDKISTGYVSKTLLKQRDVSSRSSGEERKENEAKVEVTEENQPIVQETSSAVTPNDVIQFAKQYLGYPYVLGCSSPEKGFDCSGFTRYVFGHFGYTLGTVAASQTSLGAVVERGNLQTGDLLLFYNDGKTKIGHCGIYMENGDFIHSANPQRGVVTDNLNTNSYYSERFVTARRIVE